MNGKYLQTDFGIFELRSFFSQAINTDQAVKFDIASFFLLNSQTRFDRAHQLNFHNNFCGKWSVVWGNETSVDEVYKKIQAYIEAEDKHKPLSDQKLAEQLQSDGLKVSRRTVAKYREKLNIAYYNNNISLLQGIERENSIKKTKVT